MDLKHFGDAYDIVKRSLLQWLSAFGPWAAHPMFTHEVSPDDAAAFGRFIGVPLVSTDVLVQNTERGTYLAPGLSFRSIFLDPDTGVRLHRRERSRSTEFVFADELVGLANCRPNGLLLVFDQSVPRGSEPEKMTTKLDHFGRHGLAGFAYVSQACFLVLGQSPALVNDARLGLLAASELPDSRLIETPHNIGLQAAAPGEIMGRRA